MIKHAGSENALLSCKTRIWLPEAVLTPFISCFLSMSAVAGGLVIGQPSGCPCTCALLAAFNGPEWATILEDLLHASAPHNSGQGKIMHRVNTECYNAQRKPRSFSSAG
jgi:hypothetical protein